MWLTNLKIALVEKNTDSLEKLLGEIPELSSVKEIEEAVCLLEQAAAFVQSLKNDTEHSMKQIKKNIQFLRSTESPRPNKFDMMS